MRRKKIGMWNADNISKRFLRTTMHIAVAAAVALVCAVIVVVALNVPLNLSLFKGDIAAMAQETLGVAVAMDSYFRTVIKPFCVGKPLNG